jgi:hypothetical protein
LITDLSHLLMAYGEANQTSQHDSS